MWPEVEGIQIAPAGSSIICSAINCMGRSRLAVSDGHYELPRWLLKPIGRSPWQVHITHPSILVALYYIDLPRGLIEEFLPLSSTIHVIPCLSLGLRPLCRRVVGRRGQLQCLIPSPIPLPWRSRRIEL